MAVEGGIRERRWVFSLIHNQRGDLLLPRPETQIGADKSGKKSFRDRCLKLRCFSNVEAPDEEVDNGEALTGGLNESENDKEQRPENRFSEKRGEELQL